MRHRPTTPRPADRPPPGDSTAGAAPGLALLVAVLTGACGPPASFRAEDVSDDLAASLRRDAAHLSSDAMEGRETGEPGARKAAAHVAARFRRAGLVPLPGREGYAMDFALHRRGVDRDRTGLIVEDGPARRSFAAGEHFRPFDFSDEGSSRARVVFAGYGITAPEHGHDDYEGLDVDGAFVLVFRHEPNETDPHSSFDGTETTDHGLFATKARLAAEAGARGMLLVTDPLNHAAADDLRLGGRLTLEPPVPPEGEEQGEDEPFLAVHVSRELAAAVLGEGVDLGELQAAVDQGRRPAELAPVAHDVLLTVARSGEPEEIVARNVAGYLPGSDPALAAELVVIGAHHDHLGAFHGEGDTVFNGADDNASGTAGLLALADAFATASSRPRRSLAFVTFSGEEKGLLGSRAAVSQGLLPMDRVVFMLNLDMIGRNSERPVEVIGDGYARGLTELVNAANETVGLELDLAGTTYFGNSDHDPFYRADVPFLFLFTGTHEDYHQLGDHVDELDFERMASIVTLARGILQRVADADLSPAFIGPVGWLGASLEVVEGKATVTRVEADSRATTAGLMAGDVVLSVAGEPLGAPRDVFGAFRGISPGTTAALGLEREGSRLELTVERARTGYLGIFPGGVSAELRSEHGLPEDQGVLVRRVVPEGPAESSGLKEGDVLLQVAGRNVAQRSLGAILSQVGAGETVDVLLLRDGERETLRLTLGRRPG